MGFRSIISESWFEAFGHFGIGSPVSIVAIVMKIIGAGWDLSEDARANKQGWWVSVALDPPLTPNDVTTGLSCCRVAETSQDLKE